MKAKLEGKQRVGKYPENKARGKKVEMEKKMSRIKRKQRAKRNQKENNAEDSKRSNIYVIVIRKSRRTKEYNRADLKDILQAKFSDVRL